MAVSTTTVPNPFAEKKPLIILGIVVAIIGAGLVIVDLRGAPIRAAAAQALAAEVAAESKAFCEKQGMPANTQAHTACVGGLQAVRDSQIERMTRDHQFGF
jgi:hypothetical protein